MTTIACGIVEDRVQCNCGGETTEHTIVRNKVVVCGYQKCKACGRQHVTSGQYPTDLQGEKNEP